MRIQQVRFKNLNSLIGEWEIDLTHPAFAADGIFAIAGPTGAGKTTILDAVCLALYGRTPRLSRINKSGNELMSRQTGECYAEVTFATQAGIFRCHWSQHRARKKPDGELQAPRHEIADARSGEIFQTKIRGVADRIEAATGMDFDRFTRSMLLAQGGFAAFLQAAPDERAPILEQITGTEIYSRISIRVHERRSEERTKLDALQAELAGMQLLSEEEEQQLCTSLKQKTLQDAELNRQIALKSQAITWLDGIARLENELQEIQRQREDLQTRIEVFAPAQEKLRLANQALELAGEYAALASIRCEQETDRRSLGECRESVPARAEAARLAEEAVKKAEQQLELKKAEQQKALPNIRRARELDLKIAEKEEPIKAAAGAVAESEKALAALRSRQKEDCAALEGKREILTGLLQQINETRADEGLVEHLTGIRGRFETLLNLHDQLDGKLKEIRQAEEQVTEVARLWQEQSATLASRQRRLAEEQKVLAQKQLELKTILEDKELSVWRRLAASLTEQKNLLVRAAEAARTLAKSRQALADADKRREVLAAEKSSRSGQLQVLMEKRAALERETALLETQLSLLKRIESFEEARRLLQDGEPCPLCGAAEHPFARGNIPAPDETGQRLSNVRADLKAAIDAVSELQVKQAGADKDIEQLTAGRQELAETIKEAETLIAHACADLPLDAADPDLDGKLERLRSENEAKLEHAARVVQSAEGVEKVVAGLRESLEKSKDSVARLERDTQVAGHKKDSAEQLLARLKKEAAAVQSQQEKSLNLLRQDISAYGVEIASIDDADRILAQLIGRRERWLLRLKERAELEQKMAALALQTNHQAEQIRKSEGELGKRRQQLGDLDRKRETLRRERREIFGDRNPDQEELGLAAALDAAGRDLETARQQLDAASRELSRLKSRIEELEKSLSARGARLQSTEEAFLLRLNESGFADEDSFTAACLPEGERKTLTHQAQKLADEKTGLTAKRKDRTELLEIERRKEITDEPRDEISHALTILTDSQKELQQEIGGIRRKLEDNVKLKQKQQERARAIDAQKRECTRWNLLHELIGSADGKKYRNFAQGLTFEMMIAHANRQLRKMTDRYLLIRDDAQPLELSVIDNYQAGEVRSTKNLSGGESFIVSLSLALGLSHMASKNVRVDSLFLDEGFGTLDEEALDTALETLAGLQQDGKLIGIISHVPALRERINTQILVTPRTGGRSIISGPGCGRLN